MQVLWYPSTLIDMLRLLLLGMGVYCHIQEWAYGFVGLIAVSSLLDMVDGEVARRLGQTSRLGACLDFGIDLCTHTLLWVLSGFPFAPVMILLEWAAGFSVSYLSFQRNVHWKDVMATINVKLVQRYFANGQRNWLAGIAGVSHFGFRIAWYLGYGETWYGDVFVPGIIVFEVVTAYMIWIAWRVRDVEEGDGV